MSLLDSFFKIIYLRIIETEKTINTWPKQSHAIQIPISFKPQNSPHARMSPRVGDNKKEIINHLSSGARGLWHSSLFLSSLPSNITALHKINAASRARTRAYITTPISLACVWWIAARGARILACMHEPDGSCERTMSAALQRDSFPAPYDATAARWQSQAVHY